MMTILSLRLALIKIFTVSRRKQVDVKSTDRRLSKERKTNIYYATKKVIENKKGNKQQIL